MRILIFILLSFTLLMCKSKNTLPITEPIIYVVILESDTSPKAIKKDISYDLIDFKKANKTLNQWILKFNEDSKKKKKIKTVLLNHPNVVSVFSQEQMDKINLKNSKKAKVGSIGKKNATKQ